MILVPQSLPLYHVEKAIMEHYPTSDTSSADQPGSFTPHSGSPLRTCWLWDALSGEPGSDLPSGFLD